MRKQQQQGPTVIASEYSSGQVLGLPDRPEPPRSAPEYLDPAGVRRIFGWSQEQLDRAINSNLNFPAAHGRRVSRLGGTSTPVWAKHGLIVWRDRMRDDMRALAY
jgi:hypothetical protein